MKKTAEKSLFDSLGLKQREDAPEPKPLEKPDVDAGEAVKAILIRLAVPAAFGALWALGVFVETGLDPVEIMPPIVLCVLLVAAWWIAHWFFARWRKANKGTLVRTRSPSGAVRLFGACSRLCSASSTPCSPRWIYGARPRL